MLSESIQSEAQTDWKNWFQVYAGPPPLSAGCADPPAAPCITQGHIYPTSRETATIRTEPRHGSYMQAARMFNANIVFW